MYAYMVSIYNIIFSLYQLRRPRSKNIPVAMSKSKAHVFLSNDILQKKEQAILEEMTASRAEVGNIQDKPEEFYSAKR